MNEPEQIFSDAVIRAVDSGNKIHAIRLLREETGLGLKDAKQAIDALVRERHGEAQAQAPMTEIGGAGDMVKLIVAIVIIFFIYQFFFAG
jgi:ribosomal protein L7/L12